MFFALSLFWRFSCCYCRISTIACIQSRNIIARGKAHTYISESGVAQFVKCTTLVISSAVEMTALRRIMPYNRSTFYSTLYSYTTGLTALRGAGHDSLFLSPYTWGFKDYKDLLRQPVCSTNRLKLFSKCNYTQIQK